MTMNACSFRCRLGLVTGFLWVSMVSPGFAEPDVTDTRLLADPAISAERIAFRYANDLWVADRDGGSVRRLTSHPGIESDPRFSPDGRWIAFTGRYEDGRSGDVHVVSAEGGVPRRLTWHPGADRVLGFTADGKAVMFASGREVYTGRYTQLFTVPVEGGFPTRLPIPNASKATISADGRTVAYVPLYEAFNQWKHYRGGTTARILLFDLGNSEVEQVPQPAGRCNDTDPVWLGGHLYFRSDRDGEFNLYRFERSTRSVSRVTAHEDFPVLALSAGGGALIYEQAGYLHRFEPANGRLVRLRIGVAAELTERRARWAKGTKWVRGASVSPSGNRVAIEYRGEIVTVPREKGDDRNLTQTVAVHERSPAWSPDGRWIAYFSDAGGEYGLHLAPQDGKGETRVVPIPGTGFYSDPKWSPDSKRISFRDNSHAILVMEVATGSVVRVSQDEVYGPIPALHHAWSPDSRWLAYTRNTATYHNRIHLYSVADHRSYPVSDGLADATHPVFDGNGLYLYFLVSTDAGPVNDWFSQANADMRSVQQIYFAVLAKGVPTPLARESDEEKPEATPPAGEAAADAAKNKPSGAGEEKPKEKTAESKPKTVEVKFDADGLAERVLALPVKPGAYADLVAGGTNRVFYRRAASTDPGADAAVYRYDLTKRKEDKLLDNAGGFSISADGKRALVSVRDSLHVVDLGDKLDLDKFKVDLDRVRVRVEPVAEWAQILHEAWRVNRDFFYDPGFHGADWPAMRKKYEVFLPHLAVRDDLFRVVQWMLSELAVGHSYQSPGDNPVELESIPGGLLGADYEVAEGRYRFKKVYGGLNWNGELRAPLTEPGVDVKAGEYLLAVEGRELRAPDNLYQRFERTSGRTVEITVGPDPGGRGSRTVKVVPVGNEGALRNRDWVEGNLRRVTEATQGRVAYVYVPNTAELGHTYFKRYFFPQAHREAIIVDERHNGGGSVADYYIDILRRPVVSYWAMRYGADLKTPIAGIHGPKVMLIDETAGSGGDLLPWMFRKFGLGPLIGKRTWGGLVGILGFPVLLDGASVTAPNLAFWDAEGFGVENVGVPPDIEVEQTPKEVIAGKDPQLEKAIETVLKQLDRDRSERPTRPGYPRRVR